MRTVNEHLETYEEKFSLLSFYEHVKGKLIFEAVNDELFSFADKRKFVSVCTDGAPVFKKKHQNHQDLFINSILWKLSQK